MNNEFFGLTYQLILVFGAVWISGRLFKNIWLNRGLAVFWLLFAVCHLALGRKAFWVVCPEANKTEGLNILLARRIISDGPVSGREEIPVFTSFGGLIDATSQQWICYQRGWPLICSDLHRSNDLDALKAACVKAAYVEVALPCTTGVYEWLPSAVHQAELISWLDHSVRFQAVSFFPAQQGGVYLYKNLGYTQTVFYKGDVSFPFYHAGFLPMEGPYPQFDLPRVRWGLSPASSIELVSASDQTALLEASVRGAVGRGAELRLNGSTLARWKMERRDFVDYTVQLNLKAGKNHLELIYDGFDPEQDGYQRALLFRNFTIRFHETEQSQARKN